MNKFKSLIITDIAISILIIMAIFSYRFLIEAHPPGFILIGLIIFLSLNIAFCLFSIVAIHRGKDKFVLRIWFFVISLFVFYFLLDLAGGLIFLHPYHKSSHKIEVDPLEHKFMEESYSKILPDEILHHKLPADSVMRMYYPDEYDVNVNIGKTGFRSNLDSKEKDPSKIRILMLGDSFILGEGSEDNETSSYLLEEYLNATANNRYEVINLEVSSYAPILEYLQLKENIKTMKPDVVIMNLDMSDIVQEYVYRHDGKFNEKGEPVSVNGFPEYVKQRETLKSRITTWTYNHLFITTALIEISYNQFFKDVALEELNLENAVMRKNRTLLLHTIKADFKEFNLCMSMVEDSIIRTKQLCDKYGSKFILTTYPWGHQVNDREWIPGRYGFLPKSFELSNRTIEELDRFSKANEITFFNAFPFFRGYKGKEPLYYNHDMHFTPYGQKLMAQFLYKRLLEFFIQQ